MRFVTVVSNMVLRRNYLFPLALLFVCSTGAAVRARIAPILPEVERHLDTARTEVQRGAFGSAAGHTAVVLVGDQISYAISFESIPKNIQPSCLKALSQAFETWQRETGNTVKFTEQDDPGQAQIQVVFKPSVQMGTEQVAGFTNWKRSINMNGDKLVDTTYHADMQLRVYDLDYHAMSMEAMRHEACHETGHVLGLDDSPNRGDLMGPLDIEHPVNGPTAKEALAVRNLRDEAKKIQAAALAADPSKL